MMTSLPASSLPHPTIPATCLQAACKFTPAAKVLLNHANPRSTFFCVDCTFSSGGIHFGFPNKTHWTRFPPPNKNNLRPASQPERRLVLPLTGPHFDNPCPLHPFSLPEWIGPQKVVELSVGAAKVNPSDPSPETGLRECQGSIPGMGVEGMHACNKIPYHQHQFARQIYIYIYIHIYIYIYMYISNGGI